MFYDLERRLMDCIHTSQGNPGRILQGYGEFGPDRGHGANSILHSKGKPPSESQPLAVDASRAPSPQVDHRRDWPEVSCGLSVDGDQTLSTIVIALRKLDRPRITPSVSHQLVERHGQMSYTGASMKGTVDTSCCQYVHQPLPSAPPNREADCLGIALNSASGRSFVDMAESGAAREQTGTN